MSNSSYFSGAVYVRDYILAVLNGHMNGTLHTSDLGADDPKFQAYAEIHDIITSRFGDMFTELKGMM